MVKGECKVKMDDEGSLMIEMSLITPVLIGVVFVVINLFVIVMNYSVAAGEAYTCLLYTSPSPRDRQKSRMPSSA